MEKLKRSELFSLEQYAQNRKEFRERVRQHKEHRKLTLGPNTTLAFEDRLTIQYQIQEMLRVEKIFESQGIDDELATYNPLIPDGNNWKATFMVEYTDPEKRRQALQKLLGIEHKVWMKVADLNSIYAIADEDMPRSTQAKTSAVHFLRFQLSNEQLDEVKSGALLKLGVDHEHYRYEMDISGATKQSLIDDLD